MKVIQPCWDNVQWGQNHSEKWPQGWGLQLPEGMALEADRGGYQFWSHHCGRHSNAPKEGENLICGNYVQAWSHGEGELGKRWNWGCWSDDPELGRLSWIIWVRPLSSQGSLKGEERTGRENWKREPERWQWETDLMMFLALKMEERATKSRNLGSLWKLEKGGNRFSPRAPRRNTTLTPWFQHKETHFRLLTSRTLRIFKPLSLW